MTPDQQARLHAVTLTDLAIEARVMERAELELNRLATKPVVLRETRNLQHKVED